MLKNGPRRDRVFGPVEPMKQNETSPHNRGAKSSVETDDMDLDLSDASSRRERIRQMHDSHEQLTVGEIIEDMTRHVEVN